MNAFRLIVAATALLILTTGIADAESLEFDALDVGWYRQNTSDSGFHDPAVENYLAGRYSVSQYRNFFVFDLSSITSDVTGATLTLNVLGTTSGSETYELYHVSTDVADLIAGGSNKSTIFADLGAGDSFGSREIFDSEADSYIEIVLDTDLVNDSIDQNGMLVIGGALTSLEQSSTADEYVFGYEGETPFSYAKLTVVPEPGTLTLLLIGAVFAICYIGRGSR